MSDPNDDDLRPAYDLSELSGGVQGRQYRQYHEGSNIVVLEPDVAEAFPDARSVNEALRKLIAEADRGATQQSLRASRFARSDTAACGLCT